MLCLLCLMVLAIGNSQAASPDHLATFLADPRPATAQFSQKDEKGISKGKITLAAGGKLRWEQTSPYKSLMVSDGTSAWQVDYDLQQATRLQASLSEGWASILSNRKGLEKQYSLETTGSTIKLIPKNRNQAPEASIFFDAKGNPARVVIHGTPQVEIAFTGWARAPESRSIFQYTPEKGMDVIGQ